MRPAIVNCILGATLLAVPVCTEVLARDSVQLQSAGLGVLLYEPFPWAYPLLSAVLFAALNARFSVHAASSWWLGASKGALLSAVWFVATFFAVVQIHLKLGGVL
ncbi:hypothetical protein [Paucibacter soli]|uniref:hypothetical protein n=1 Tax=Paucibacter soli TaxID=3133433 RepID=UPI0030A24CA2